jgi:hypothetical protein
VQKTRPFSRYILRVCDTSAIPHLAIGSDMDRSTEEALKAIITGLAAAQAKGSELVEAIGKSPAISSSLSAEAGDPFTAGELARPARWAKPKAYLPAAIVDAKLSQLGFGLAVDACRQISDEVVDLHGISSVNRVGSCRTRWGID